MKPAKSPKPSFPLAEGFGVFVGIVSWYLLTDGRLEILNALAITVPVTLFWFGLRSRPRRPARHDKSPHNESP